MYCVADVRFWVKANGHEVSSPEDAVKVLFKRPRFYSSYENATAAMGEAYVVQGAVTTDGRRVLFAVEEGEVIDSCIDLK